MLWRLYKFCTGGLFQPRNVTRVFNYSDLHTQTDTQIRNLVFTGIFDGGDLSFNAPLTKATGYQDCIDTFQGAGAFALNVLRIDVLEFDSCAVVDASMNHGLDQALVGLEQVHVFADHGHGDGTLRIDMGVDHADPLRQVRFLGFDVHALNHIFIESFGVQHARNLINAVSVLQANDRSLLNVGEQSNFSATGLINFMIATTNQHVRLQTNRAEFFNRVLSWLGFRLAGGCNVRHQSQVN